MISTTLGPTWSVQEAMSKAAQLTDNSELHLSASERVPEGVHHLLGGQSFRTMLHYAQKLPKVLCLP